MCISGDAIISLKSMIIGKETEKAFQAGGEWFPKSVATIAEVDMVNGKKMAEIHVPAWFLRKNDIGNEKMYADNLVSAPAKREPEQLEMAMTVGPVTGIMDLFAKAKQKLKYPMITFEVSGIRVRLKAAGPNSKYAGCILVTNGAAYGDPSNLFYGRVTPDGQWVPQTYAAALEHAALIGDILIALAEKPAETAAEFGKMSGKCCFCNSELTDEKSTKVGYGPVCAAHFGLPHGNKTNKA